MSNHKNNLNTIRHTLAHVMALAVKEIWPDVKFGIGPVIDNGFYYDFSIDHKLSELDFPEIERKMTKIIESDLPVEHLYIPIEEAMKEAKVAGQKYKLELLEQIKKGERKALDEKDIAQEENGNISFYKIGHFSDLCKGPHVESTSDLKDSAFKLSHTAGAYWLGDEKNDQLQRIYAFAFESQNELEKHIQMLKEAKERDHKKLGKELDLFTFSEIVGKGLPLWTPKGSTIRRELERFIVDEEIRRGYLHVYTPDIAKLDLYKKSGHYPYYKESMYSPIQIDDEEFMLRPMTCPHHFELYLSKPHSYRDLPMRIAELAQLYRYEQSGELSGLQRVRSFCLADAHIICADEKQAISEVAGALDLIEFITKTLGLEQGKNYWYRLSLGDRNNSEKYYKDDSAWDTGEILLRELLNNRKAHFVEAQDEAAFYGPKIDIQMRNVNGKEDTAFTVQYDFCMPNRFNLNYIDNEGKEKRAFVVHRSSIGAIERIIAFLIEHYAGAFPLWLSPVQVSIIPISDKQLDFAQELHEKLINLGFRSELNSSNETLGKRIRESESQKIPYIAVIGDKEISADAIAIRKRGKGDLGQIKIEEFISQIKEEKDLKK